MASSSSCSSRSSVSRPPPRPPHLLSTNTKSNLDPSLVEDICLGNVSDAKAAYYIRASRRRLPLRILDQPLLQLWSQGHSKISPTRSPPVPSRLVSLLAQSPCQKAVPHPPAKSMRLSTRSQDAADCSPNHGPDLRERRQRLQRARQEQDKYAAEVIPPCRGFAQKVGEG